MKRQADSDSEEDEDYVPPDTNDDESSDSDVDEEKAPSTEEPQVVKEKKDLTKVWQDFQATVAATAAPKDMPSDKLVKVVRKYRFAGEEHEEVIEVLENSEDAKRWPRYQVPEPTFTLITSSTSVTSTSNGATVPVESQIAGTSTLPSQPQPPPQTESVPILPAVQPKPKPPGPRKPKTTIAPLPSSSKAKKITTLEKSAMDWTKHVRSEKESGIQDELERHKKDGGYLEKVEFLQRVDERKESKRVRRG